MRKKLTIALLGAFGAVLLVAGMCFSGDVLDCLGQIKKYDKDKGEMVLIELDKDNEVPTGKNITVTDNGTERFAKNKEIMTKRKIWVSYEETDGKNIVQKYRLIPGGC